jgi:nucleoid-associated protein YgaU
VNRYPEHIGVFNSPAQKKRRYETLYYPPFERQASDIFIITKSSDRLDLLAFDYYGDTRYWVIIAKANKLANGSIRIPVGTRLRIPYPLDPGTIQEQFRERQF